MGNTIFASSKNMNIRNIPSHLACSLRIPSKYFRCSNQSVSTLSCLPATDQTTIKPQPKHMEWNIIAQQYQSQNISQRQDASKKSTPIFEISFTLHNFRTLFVTFNLVGNLTQKNKIVLIIQRDSQVVIIVRCKIN